MPILKTEMALIFGMDSEGFGTGALNKLAEFHTFGRTE